MRSVVAHIVSCILLAGISLMTSCREDEVIILAEYERLPLGDNSRSDYAGLYLLNEGNMGSNKCTLDFVDFENGYYVRNLYAEKNPNVVKELGDVGNDVQIYGSKMRLSTARIRSKSSMLVLVSDWDKWTYLIADISPSIKVLLMFRLM